MDGGRSIRPYAYAEAFFMIDRMFVALTESQQHIVEGNPLRFYISAEA